MKLVEKGIGSVTLAQNDFKASGGEGDIYLKNGKAYKIYQDVSKVIPEAKIHELSTLSLPTIIKPENILLNDKNNPVGYSMRVVPDSYTLCQLFPKAFKNRNNLTSDKLCKILLDLRAGIQHVHDRNIIVVDVNELNFLVSKDFFNTFFIDVDSYKTKSFNPTAIMDSVRDRHTKEFTALTDWFSFGVIAFNLLTGIHPFRGSYQPYSNIKDLQANLDARMLNNISVLNKDVKVPPVVEKFSSIPKAWYDWFLAIFEQGKRVAPPRDLIEQVLIAAPVIKISSKLIVEAYIQLKDTVTCVDGDFVYTAGEVFYKNKSLKIPTNSVVFLSKQLNKPYAVFLQGRDVLIADVALDTLEKQNFQADEIMCYDNTVYLRAGDKLLYLDILEIGPKLLVSPKLVCGIMPHATKVFKGCVIQNILGRHVVSILDKPGVNRQFEIKELAGTSVIDAKFENGVLIVSAIEKAVQKHFILKVAQQSTAYSLRVVESGDVVNFITLDNGICIYANDGKLELFSNNPGSDSVSVVEDSFLQQPVLLAKKGMQALAIVGNEVVKISLKK